MPTTTTPVPRTVGEVLDRVLAAEPGREALVCRSGRWSYAGLDGLANRAARALAAFGLGPGDRVAGSLPNDVDVVAAFHGAMRLGAVWVGVNRALAAPEKRHVVEDSDANIFLGDEAAVADVAGMPGLRTVVAGPGEWADALAAAEASPLGFSADPDAPAGIAYTSGTTGFPKGAVHSQRNLLLPGASLVASRGYGPGLRKGDCLPLTILNLQVLTTLLTAQAGGCAVVMDRIDAEAVARWVRAERVTTWNGPPALLHALVADDTVAPSDLASLDEVWSGGGDCPESLRARFRAKFGHAVVTTYGLSEAPTVVAIDPRDGSHVPGSSGRVLPHLQVRVLDGELCIATATTGPWAGAWRPMLGYWRNPEATAETVRDGVLHTGDLGHVDADGYLHVRDRKRLVIIRGGANVYPAEVERVLAELRAVEASVVIGVPDERLGERVAAAVLPAAGAELSEELLREHCLARLARYKVPERWVFVDAFARNSMGKINRRELGSLFG